MHYPGYYRFVLAGLICLLTTGNANRLYSKEPAAPLSASVNIHNSEPGDTEEFPPELVSFEPYKGNPVFTGTGKDTWDRNIRERGYILREGDKWYLWYTGFNMKRTNCLFLGLATSNDGFHWQRYKDNPIFFYNWTEDMQVVKHDGVYYMFAEGRFDIAHMLTSTDKIHWRDWGSLDIRYTNGKPLSAGPYGTPTAWVENGKWYLFYERRDMGIWLASSRDLRTWINIQDDPVIPLGPAAYDRAQVAMNQVIRYRGRYYAYYHANSDTKGKTPWTTNVAVSRDLIHWKKYPGNPIIRSDNSSGILVNDGKQYRLYTMHPDVRVWFPRKNKTANSPGADASCCDKTVE